MAIISDELELGVVYPLYHVKGSTVYEKKCSVFTKYLDSVDVQLLDKKGRLVYSWYGDRITITFPKSSYKDKNGIYYLDRDKAYGHIINSIRDKRRALNKKLLSVQLEWHTQN